MTTLLAPFSILGKLRLHKGCDLARGSQPDQSRAWTVSQVSCLSELSSDPGAVPSPSVPQFLLPVGGGAGAVLGLGSSGKDRSGWVCGCRFRSR